MDEFSTSILKDVQEYLIEDEGRKLLLTVRDFQSIWRHIQEALTNYGIITFGFIFRCCQ
jgi:hypothetical protein